MPAAVCCACPGGAAHIASQASSRPQYVLAHTEFLSSAQVYTRFYAADVGGEPGNDQFLYCHPNGLCIVGLAPTHAVFAARPASDQPGTSSGGPAAGAASASSERAQERVGGGLPSSSSACSISFDVEGGNLLDTAKPSTKGQIRRGTGAKIDPETQICRWGE